MKKILLYLFFCFFGAKTFSQTTMFIYNSSPYKVRMQVQALPNSGITTTTLTAASYITIPPGTPANPTVYTFTNFNNTAPATLTSQFTQWTRKTGTVSANLTKLNTQNLYGPIPTWNLIKFDVLNAATNAGLGSGGIARQPSGYYPTNWPCNTAGCTSPGSPMPAGSTFAASWNYYFAPPALNSIIINFQGI